MTHRFNRYCAKHGKYPGFRRGNIVCRIAPGYITLERRFMRIYIPREVLYPLLKWLIPLAREMDENFDPEEATGEYLRMEALHQEALAAQKRSRKRAAVRKGSRTTKRGRSARQ